VFRLPPRKQMRPSKRIRPTWLHLLIVMGARGRKDSDVGKRMGMEFIPKHSWPPNNWRTQPTRRHKWGMWGSATGYGTVARGMLDHSKTWHRLLEGRGREMGDGSV
ncbi:hypothetical protein GW17_00058119, partial [Ensete ventricosum]